MSGFVEFCLLYCIPIFMLMIGVQGFYRYLKFEKPISELLWGISFLSLAGYLITHQRVIAYVSIVSMSSCLVYALIFDHSFFYKNIDDNLIKIELILMPLLFGGGYVLYTFL